MTVTRKFEAALRIVEKLRAAGYEAYFAGGCVRDLLLGREPLDYDVLQARRRMWCWRCLSGRLLWARTLE